MEGKTGDARGGRRGELEPTDPHVPANWTRASRDRPPSKLRRPQFEAREPCPCDTKYGVCEPNCCCDRECTEEYLRQRCREVQDDVDSWLCGRASGSTPRGSSWYRDLLPLFCLYARGGSYLGTFFPDRAPRTRNEMEDRVGRSSREVERVGRASREVERVGRASREEERMDAPYRVGVPVQRQAPDGSVERLTFPGAIAGNACARNLPVLFGVNRKAACMVALRCEDASPGIAEDLQVLSRRGRMGEFAAWEVAFACDDRPCDGRSTAPDRGRCRNALLGLRLGLVVNGSDVVRVRVGVTLGDVPLRRRTVLRRFEVGFVDLGGVGPSDDLAPGSPISLRHLQGCVQNMLFEIIITLKKNNKNT
ncbi:unnamed protein product [Darwinula stevensoni]|uniref:Tectonic domain-containing protein n=1 Tax=Darwinula stevensoni TaxID=69355 RepID=A0A7R9AHR9_9CRUS|nr:unnamed protein product [Darwinula stevensoni]CAG0905718.1 unnamed protein product [Darwinula stevensoni]